MPAEMGEGQMGAQPTDVSVLHGHLEQIDAQFSRDGVLMNIRAYQAVQELALLLGEAGPLGDLHAQPAQHQLDHYLVRVTARWYDEKYGTHDRFDASPGSAVIWLAQRPWRIRFPRLYGRFSAICWPLDGYPDQAGHSGAVLDVLEYIDDFPPGLRIRLSEDARLEIRRDFVFASDTLHMLQDRKESKKIKEVCANLQTGVSRIMDAPRHCGESKWNSFEAAEKALKGYLDFRQVTYERKHGLVKLWYQVQEAGLQTRVTEADLVHLDCRAGVKYGDDVVSAAHAVQAHRVSLAIVRSCIDALPIDGWLRDVMRAP